MEVHERIQIQRKKQGILVADLGRMAGLSQPTMSKVLNGQRRVKESELERIAKALQTTVEVLTGESLGSLVEDRLIEMGMTYAQLAQRSKVDINWLRGLDFPENSCWYDNDGKGYPWLGRVAEVLGVSAIDLRGAYTRQRKPIGYIEPEIVIDEPADPNLLLIQKAYSRMDEPQRKKMLKLLKIVFEDEFS